MREKGNYMYCEKCRVLLDGQTCPICGNEKLRQPMADDLCFLVEKEQIWSGMLADILEQNKIPFLTKNRLGVGMALKVGPHMERVLFYVPYSHIQHAKDLVGELFTNDAIK